MKNKKLLTLLACSVFAISSLAASLPVHNADDITYDWLVKYGDDTGTTDHISVFRTIFKKLKMGTLLEFGPGVATKYFLDKCSKVISVEIITHGYGPDNLQSCLSLYRGYSNWIPIAFFSGYRSDPSWAPYKYIGTDSVYKAISYRNATNGNYAEIDDFYEVELRAFVTNLTRAHQIKVACVNPIAFIRGEMVQSLFGKVPVIVAHDTYDLEDKVPNDIWGYCRVITPDDYEEIYFPIGEGTTVWVQKSEEFQALSQYLKKYAKSI